MDVYLTGVATRSTRSTTAAAAGNSAPHKGKCDFLSNLCDVLQPTLAGYNVSSFLPMESSFSVLKNKKKKKNENFSGRDKTQSHCGMS